MHIPQITVYLQLVPNRNNWATPYDRSHTPQVKLKEQGKSQGTGRETHHTQPAVYLGQEKLEIKIL